MKFKFKNLNLSKQISIWLAMLFSLIVLLSIGALVSIEGIWVNTA